MVEVPPLKYLMIDGHGDPNTAVEYAEALEALYSLAYTLKFQVKRESGGENGGYAPAGKHHEIYLSDPRRTAPGKLRTVIRQPIAPVGASARAAESGRL